MFRFLRLSYLVSIFPEAIFVHRDKCPKLIGDVSKSLSVPMHSIAIGSHFRLILALIAGACSTGAFLGYPLDSLAHPLETFSAPISITCGEGQRQCSGVLRVDGALGGHTGISVVKGLAGEVSLIGGRPTGKLLIEAEDATDLAVTFSWDGDSNPDVLSGAGLNCFDLTQQGAYAFIISNFSAVSDCNDDALISECPNFTIDSRVYDSQDPTGQRFSASTIVRGQVKDAELAIPFSNFVRFGPRGKGSFTCTGAVTLTFRWRGIQDLEVDLGQIYTNGKEGLRTWPTAASVPSTTHASVKLPTTGSPLAIATPSAQSTTAPSPTGVFTERVLVATPGGQQKSPEQLKKAEQKPLSPVANKPTPITSEVVYGSVVTGQ